MSTISVYNSRVVREIQIDDGTTGGKLGYVDDWGVVWVESVYSEKTAPTGQMPARMVDGKIYR